jgi:hypothetical protein
VTRIYTYDTDLKTGNGKNEDKYGDSGSTSPRAGFSTAARDYGRDANRVLKQVLMILRGGYLVS